MNKNVVIVIVLSILVIISAVQAVQLTKLKTEISSGNLALGASAKTTTVSTGSSITPSSLDQLDTMVGGC